MRKYLAISGLALSLGVASPAMAGTWCTGTLLKSYLQNDGSLIVETSWSGWTKVCNLKADWQGITPDICAGWLARVDAAVSMDLAVQIHYDETYASCAAVPITYQSPAPVYIMIF